MGAEPGGEDTDNCIAKCPKEGCDEWCDVVAGESWCELLGKCIVTGVEMCLKPEDVPHPCPPGQAFCFCDGSSIEFLCDLAYLTMVAHSSGKMMPTTAQKYFLSSVRPLRMIDGM